MKLRPVLLLTAPIGASSEVVAVYISSVIPATFLPSDILLDPQTPKYASTGLKVASCSAFTNWRQFTVAVCNVFSAHSRLRRCKTLIPTCEQS